MDTYYTVDELAQLWKCNPKLVYELLTKGELEGLKLGRVWRISERARLAFETQHTQAKRTTRRKILQIT